MKLYVDTKPTLEWVDCDDRHFAGDYEVKRHDGRYYTSFEGWILAPPYHDTLEQAKAAAQADYDRRTAERFREVEVPKKIEYNRTIPPNVDLHNRGFNSAIDALKSAIAKAKETQTENIQSAIGAGEGEV